MQKGVLTGLFLLILAVFLYVGYSSYSHRSNVDAYEDGVAGGRTRADVKAERTGAPASALPAMPTTGDGGMVAQGGGAASATGMTPPGTDSIAPNPPNGMTFGGSGHYQLYRQGDLTWRLNTETGETCVIFATDEEWRKPKVYKAGCRGR